MGETAAISAARIATSEPVKDTPTKPVPTTSIRRKPVPALQQTAPHTPAQSLGRLSQIRKRWSLLTRRTRVIILTGALLLLILIIGLAAGLSTRKSSSVQNLPLPSNHGGPYTGELTYYAPGLGACGVTSTDSDRIVAVSQIIFDAVQVGGNPNSNPLCGQKIRAKRVKEGQGERSVDLMVVDRCTGCQPRDLDVTINTFADLADVDLGRVDITWSWLTDVPGGASTR